MNFYIYRILQDLKRLFHRAQFIYTVEHEMFACMKCSRISRNREIREIFMHANICSLFSATSQFLNFSNRTIIKGDMA